MRLCRQVPAVTGRLEDAAAGTAVIAVQTSGRLLTGLVHDANSSYKTGLYLDDWDRFLHDTATRTHRPNATLPVPANPMKIEATPACAGSTSYEGLALVPSRDHPRMCGERRRRAGALSGRGRDFTHFAKLWPCGPFGLFLMSFEVARNVTEAGRVGRASGKGFRCMKVDALW
ncbi:hypothetical protein ACH41E_02750 [Streptomyces sp. NPDC020412]|uniref:hypothetical protein n=1 Tax=Streptomyces sp. NPDC020412 TaxID=3365073 RepID=UPI00378792E7